MFYNYLKIALRSLVKKRVFSFINIVGLALGMSACLSIFYYVNYEFSFNENFKDSELVYRTYFSRQMENGKLRLYMNPAAGLKVAMDEVPEIESSFRLVYIDYQNNSLIYKDAGKQKTLEQQGVKYADGDIAQTLGLEMISGSFDKMNEPMKVALGYDVASKFFDPSEAIGKTITLSGNIGNNDYEIIGVFEDLPSNSTLNFSVLLSMSSMEKIEGLKIDKNWDNWRYETYLKTKNSQNEINQALKINITDDEVFQADETTWKLNTLPLNELHLTTVNQDGELDKSAENLLYGLSIIGFFILAIAWINFINLSTARAMERAREVGIRKAMGSQLLQIRGQFLIESFLTNCVAAILALTIVQIALPSIFKIDGLMKINPQDQILFWGSFTGLLLAGSFLSGLYPAFVLSSFKPAVVLKGKMTGQKSGELLRKGLVIFQFAASAFMIIGTYIVFEQITYLKNKELGLNINDMLLLDAPPNNVNADGDSYYQTINSFKEEVSQLNFVNAITASSDVPGEGTGWGTSLKLVGENDESRKRIGLLACDKDFAEAYQIELVAGRFYKQGDGTFDKGHFVINEAAVEYLGFSSPEEAIGKVLIEGRMFPELTIIGVLKDFHQASLKNRIEPLAMVYSSWSNYYSLSLNVDEDSPAEIQVANLKAGIGQIEAVWTKFFPEFPFDYNFLDDKFNEQYKSDNEFTFIITLFAVLSVIIASLGLLGLASYSIIQRTKEIGIRKVLGASIGRIIGLLSLQYIWLITAAVIVAIPLTYFGVSKWLTSYPYKIELSIWMFALPVAIIFLIALFTIGTQVLVATKKNPVDSLRYE